MKYWIHPDAASELNDAANYYAEIASKEIAKAFISEFEKIKDLIVWNQKLGKEFEQGIRIYYFQRFPFGLVYCEGESGPEIYAVCHHRREPGYWKSRI